MFINIAEFPPIKKGKDEEFKKWFEWSNSQVSSPFLLTFMIILGYITKSV